MSLADIKKLNSVKKKKLRHIHFAVVKDTGELVSINDVRRGLACGCACAACGKDMEARKGDKRRHHFAHVSNYDCLYGLEIAVYMAVNSALEKHMKIMLPSAVLYFNSYKRPETVKEAGLQELTHIDYQCEEKQYPPNLFCFVGESCLQIIINFENYYSRYELDNLAEQARNNGSALLLIDVPDIDALSSFDVLEELLLSNTGSKEWLHNRLLYEKKERYKNAAVMPQKSFGGYTCAAQKNKYNNVYYARLEDCIRCAYCFDIESEHLCLASSYVNHIDDFSKPLDERKKIFEEENKIERIKSAEEYKCPLCGHQMRLVNGRHGPFASCSNYPYCEKTYSIEPNTGQVIVK